MISCLKGLDVENFCSCTAQTVYTLKGEAKNPHRKALKWEKYAYTHVIFKSRSKKKAEPNRKNFFQIPKKHDCKWAVRCGIIILCAITFLLVASEIYIIYRSCLCSITPQTET